MSSKIDYEYNFEPYKVDITQYRSNEKLVSDMLSLGQAFQSKTVKASDNVQDDSVIVNRPYVQIDDLADFNKEINALADKLKHKQVSVN